MLTLLFALAISVDPTGVVPLQAAPEATTGLTHDNRAQLAESVLSGSPDDPIRHPDRERPQGITERQAWAVAIDGQTMANPPGEAVGHTEADLERQRLARDAVQDAAAERRNYSFGDMVGAAWDGTITAAIGRTIARRLEADQPDPGFDYVQHMGTLEEGRSLREREELRSQSRSLAHAQVLIARQDQARDNADSLASPAGGATALAARLLDPAAWLLALGVLAALWRLGGRRAWDHLRQQSKRQAVAQ